jgi:CRISPR/Cas system-associated exonuclease Cas4 (RecB family)
MYEECPHKVKLKYIDRIPEPERELPPGKDEHPMDRGSRVHDGCEKFVMGDLADLPVEANKYFSDEFEHLRKLYKRGLVELEMSCGVDKGWEFVPEWNDDTWCLIKMDAELKTDDMALIIDYKTGKRRYNEVKHAEQMQLYQIAFFKKHPDINKLRTELWYLDLGEVHGMNYTRKQGMVFQRTYDRRAKKMLRDKQFTPTPSQYACRFCPYGQGKNKTGHCQMDVTQ